MMPEFRCEVPLRVVTMLYNRFDKCAATAAENEALHRENDDLRQCVNTLNKQVADKDDEIATIKQTLAAGDFVKRHTLTDIELATISELRKMADEKKIPVGAKVRAVLLNAAKFISEKGDI